MDEGASSLVTALVARDPARARDAFERLARDADARSGAPDLVTWFASGPPRRLLPLLATRADVLGLDPRLIEASERAADEAWGLNERLLALTGPVIERLVAEGVRVVALKGLALLGDVWSSHRRRALGDADLLVRPRDATAALRLIVGAGWRTESGRGPRRVPRARRAIQTVHASGVSIDLHLRPTPLTPHRMLDPAVWDAVGPVAPTHPLAATGLERPSLAQCLVIGASHLAWGPGRLPHGFVDLARLRDALAGTSARDLARDTQADVLASARADRVLRRVAAVLGELASLEGDQHDSLAEALSHAAVTSAADEARIERRAIAAMDVLAAIPPRPPTRRALAHVRMVATGEGARAHVGTGVQVVTGWIAARRSAVDRI